MIEIKKKNEKPEDFVGWKSEDGKLEVIGFAANTCYKGKKLYKVTCTECSKDPELFPEGYFVCTKGNLERGIIPCGCSKRTKWTERQYIIKAKRVGNKKNIIIHGFAGEFKGSKTKLDCECAIDGYRWSPFIGGIVNAERGCPKCSILNMSIHTEQQSLEKCIEICNEEGYEPVGFIGMYKNKRTRFEYICSKHGKISITLYNFFDNKNRCMGCYKEKACFYGYYPERIDEIDYLYVLNFDNQYIKVGRSFNVKRRIGKSELQKESGISNIKVLSVYTAKHGIIYPTEQEIHAELRERNFDYYPETWSSTECFQNDSLFMVEKLLEQSGLEKVEDYRKVKYNAKD